VVGPLVSRSACVLVLAAGACHAPLHLPKADAQGPLPSGGTDLTGGVRSDGGDAGGESDRVPGLSADSLRVCTYTASGQDLAVTVFRNEARTTYTLISSLFASPIVQSIGVESDNLFTYEIERNHTLAARTVSNGLLRFADVRSDPSGPGWTFHSFCSVDGIQIRQVPKDYPLHMEIIRADDTTYRVDLPERWNLGSYVIHFYDGAEGTTTSTELGTQTEVVTHSPDGSSHLAFTDLDGRRVGIDLTSYGVLAAIRIESP
jgi:hypothetical protein